MWGFLHDQEGGDENRSGGLDAVDSFVMRLRDYDDKASCASGIAG